MLTENNMRIMNFHEASAAIEHAHFEMGFNNIFVNTRLGVYNIVFYDSCMNVYNYDISCGRGTNPFINIWSEKSYKERGVAREHSDFNILLGKLKHIIAKVGLNIDDFFYLDSKIHNILRDRFYFEDIEDEDAFVCTGCNSGMKYFYSDVVKMSLYLDDEEFGTFQVIF